MPRSDRIGSFGDAEDTYFLALKVVGNGCDHEGLKHFGVKRTPSVEYARLTTNDLCDANQRLEHRARHLLRGDVCLP